MKRMFTNVVTAAGAALILTLGGTATAHADDATTPVTDVTAPEPPVDEAADPGWGTDPADGASTLMDPGWG